ncbi:hypothetical protein SAQ01S_07700 [Sphingomonas aquatilis NBRC 16722]|uniref:Lipoprotein n=1 Tax=Sphingomonas aquatilis TaxID=93063 RepID=A0AAW3TQI6_9SPHN|nr:hypothetical protein [Sphingomonas aquatilis]MBB3875311.1 hypothetical protein [Sphingomonas aquatilis]GEM71004.1 hypothetical protein SAQ01S_07700 [Sphingomonas aquatilis NBRC 16722]
MRVITYGLLPMLVGCQQVPGTVDYDLRARMEEAVKGHLKDPESAQFSDVSYYSERNLACGMVNAKNSLGGYTGPKAFAYIEGDAYSTEWGADHNKFLRANHECLAERIKQLRAENPGVKFDDPGPFQPLK